jgi:hypothetical protein
MVAASIHGLALSPQGTSAPPDRNTASSQGALMETMDAIQGGFGPKTDPGWLLGKGWYRDGSQPDLASGWTHCVC